MHTCHNRAGESKDVRHVIIGPIISIWKRRSEQNHQIIFARRRMRRLYTLAVGLVRMVERIIVQGKPVAMLASYIWLDGMTSHRKLSVWAFEDGFLSP
jgi:hypothetical protein